MADNSSLNSLDSRALVNTIRLVFSSSISSVVARIGAYTRVSNTVICAKIICSARMLAWVSQKKDPLGVSGSFGYQK